MTKQNDNTTQDMGPIPPFMYHSGNLGIADGGRPWIYFVDANDQKWLTRSVEEILREIHHFTGDERGHKQLLAGAALHYALDVWALINGRAESATPT